MSQAQRVRENAARKQGAASDTGEHPAYTQATRRLVPFRLEVLTTDQDDEEDTLVLRTKEKRKLVARAFEDLAIDEEAAVPSEREAYARDDFESTDSVTEPPAPLHSGTRLLAATVPMISDDAPVTRPSGTGAFESLPAFESAFESAFRSDRPAPPSSEEESPEPRETAPASEAPASKPLSSKPTGLISTAPGLSSVLSYTNVTDTSGLMAPEVLRFGSSFGFGVVRNTLTPETKRAMRASREAARRAKAAATWMRVVVVGIWGTAVLLAVLLALFARIGS
jgi:hypothetical protein